MRYTELLHKAFATAWKYKYLWVLGFFADLTSFFSYTGKFRERIPPDFWHRFADFEYAGLLAGISILLMFLIFIAVVIFIIIERIAEGGLIANAGFIHRGEPHNLSTAWHAGFKYFLRMMGVLILQLVLIFTYILTFAGVFIFLGVGIGGPVLLVSLVFLVPLFFIGIFFIAIIFSFAERFVVLEHRSVFNALTAAWDLLRRELAKSVAMGLLAALIMICLIFAVIIVFVMLAIPLVALYMAGIVPAVLYGVLVLLPLAVVVAAYFGVYRSCLWTFFFLELRGPAARPAAPPAPTPPADSPSPPSFE
jgi:hypothetical protein